jgi:signal transduction histidine kinase
MTHPISSKDTGPGKNGKATYFASPERATDREVRRTGKVLAENPLANLLVSSIDGYLMILNEHRQVLATNDDILQRLGVEQGDCLLGKRPGEVINCVHSYEGPNGCGTSKACSSCGAVLSILESQRTNRPIVGECLATVCVDETTDALEFRVRASQVEIENKKFTALILNDISDLKRKENLERTFFHDILNTVTGLLGYSSLLVELDAAKLDSKEIAERIVILSNRLNQEIQDQRKLSQAENGVLEVEKQSSSVFEILKMVETIFQSNDVTKNKTLVVKKASEDTEIVTDVGLLGRVLINMTKNALEASNPGDTVSVQYAQHDGYPTFEVHNPGVIPDSVAEFIFQRSFSTKGEKGRGVGTYSMKLFGEKYLRGKVRFSTDVEKGTIFWISLPLSL